MVVLSAMSGETNRLIDLAKQITDHPVPRELDVIVSTGEQVTIALLTMALIKRGVPAVSYTGNRCESSPIVRTTRRASCRSTTRRFAPTSRPVA